MATPARNLPQRRPQDRLGGSGPLVWGDPQIPGPTGYDGRLVGYLTRTGDCGDPRSILIFGPVNERWIASARAGRSLASGSAAHGLRRSYRPRSSRLPRVLWTHHSDCCRLTTTGATSSPKNQVSRANFGRFATIRSPVTPDFAQRTEYRSRSSLGFKRKDRLIWRIPSNLQWVDGASVLDSPQEAER